MRPPAATCKRGHPASDSYVYPKLRWHKTEQRFVEYKCRQCRACQLAPRFGIRLDVTLSGR